MTLLPSHLEKRVGASGRTPARGPEFVVWNVGQGQWATFVAPGFCWHFDMGGERPDWAAVLTECRGKENRVSFSHWDQDHISFAHEAGLRLPGLCIAHRPLGDANPHKRRLLAGLENCKPAPMAIRELSRPGDRTAHAVTANEVSRVFEVAHVAVIPGDSPIDREAIWAPRLAASDDAFVLVLGHHGSRTSTGARLLGRLPRLETAVASARLARYGHPHPAVAQALHEKGIALLRTELWGHLHFEVSPERQPL